MSAFSRPTTVTARIPRSDITMTIWIPPVSFAPK